MPLQIIHSRELDKNIDLVIEENRGGALFQDKGAFVELLDSALKERNGGITISVTGKLLLEAVKTVRDYLNNQMEDWLVYLVLQDKPQYIVRKLYPELVERLEETKIQSVKQRHLQESCCCDFMETAREVPSLKKVSLEELIRNKPLSFSQRLLKLLDEKAIDEVEFYKRANLDRKLFSKLRGKDYKPSRNTVLAVVVGLRLSVEEADELMAAAGFGWNKGDNTDIIVMHFLDKHIYDIDMINMTLYSYGEKTLGAKMD